MTDRTQGLRRDISNLWLCCIGCLLLFISHHSGATMNDGSASMNPVVVTTDNTSVVSVVWSLRQTPTTAGANSIQSPSGFFEDFPPNILQTNNTAISSNFTVAPAQVGNTLAVQIQETLTIPQTVIAAAIANGADRLLYKRQFTDQPDNSTIDVFLTIHLQSPYESGLADALSITTVQLQFTDGSLSNTVTPGTALQAQAQLQLQGAGLLQAIWEIRTPSQPAFHAFATVEQAMANSGANTLTSPALPTLSIGAYEVRLKLLQPSFNGSSNDLLYSVVPPANGVRLLQPQPCTSATPETEFSWQAAENAVGYKLLWLDAQNSQLLSAQQVPAGQTKARPSVINRRHLPAGKLLWQVQAQLQDGSQRWSKTQLIHYQLSTNTAAEMATCQ